MRKLTSKSLMIVEKTFVEDTQHKDFVFYVFTLRLNDSD
jgi:hypothetical protein